MYARSMYVHAYVCMYLDAYTTYQHVLVLENVCGVRASKLSCIMSDHTHVHELHYIGSHTFTCEKKKHQNSGADL